MLSNVAKAIIECKTRSAWDRGVTEYAKELFESLEIRADYEGREPESAAEAQQWMLNGAQDWVQYSLGACSLIYNDDIAERLCTPSELRKLTRKDGSLREQPNSHDSWLTLQARALFQACTRIRRLIAKELNK